MLFAGCFSRNPLLQFISVFRSILKAGSRVSECTVGFDHIYSDHFAIGCLNITYGSGSIGTSKNECCRHLSCLNEDWLCKSPNYLLQFVILRTIHIEYSLKEIVACCLNSRCCLSYNF